MTVSRSAMWLTAGWALALWGCGGGGGGGPTDAGQQEPAPPLASLSVSDGPTYDFGARPVGLTVEHAFRLANAGPGEATGLATSGLAGPFAVQGGGRGPASGDACGATLAAGASCTLVVAYAPTALGSAAATLAVTFNDGEATRSVTRGLTGAAVTPASLTLSDGPLYDYGRVATGSSGERAFTLANTGGSLASAVAPSAGLTGPFNFKGGTYPGTGGTCASTLPAGATCTVVVAFAPTSSGPAGARLAIDFNDGVRNQRVTRDVTGDSDSPADVSISDGATYDFGALAVGTAADHTFTVFNAGGLPAEGLAASGLSAPFSFKGGAYPGTGGTCGDALPPRGTCKLAISYAPDATGDATTTLALGFNAGATPGTVTRAMRGTAIVPGALVISDAPSYDFGTRAVGSSIERAFTLTNSGSFTINGLSGTFPIGPYTYQGGFPGRGGTCVTLLAPGADCTVVVTFAPTAGGRFPEALNVFYNDGAATRMESRPLRAAAAARALLAFSDGPAYDFGVRPAGSATEHTFTVTNFGGVTATALSVSGLAAPFALGEGTCGASLAPGASCTVVVTFIATGDASSAATLALEHDDGVATRAATCALSGTSTTPALLSISSAPDESPTEGPFDYGAVDAPTDHVFTVRNSGALAATGLGDGGTLGPGFAFTGGAGYPGAGGTCGAWLAPGDACTVAVTFTPGGEGPASSTLTLTYDNGAGPRTAARGLTGTAASTEGEPARRKGIPQP